GSGIRERCEILSFLTRSGELPPCSALQRDSSRHESRCRPSRANSLADACAKTPARSGQCLSSRHICKRACPPCPHVHLSACPHVHISACPHAVARACGPARWPTRIVTASARG